MEIQSQLPGPDLPAGGIAVVLGGRWERGKFGSWWTHGRGWRHWAASQGWPLGIQRKVVGGEMVPGSSVLLGLHLATVTPNKVLPHLRETINTSSSVLFTKGQHFVDAHLMGTCLSHYGVSGSIVIPILHTTLFLENREAHVSQGSHSSLGWCMYV